MGRAANRPHAASHAERRREVRARVWTDERILAELRRAIEGRQHFPTQQELRAAGLGNLADAITRYGGAKAWAERIGLRLRPAQDVVSYSEPYTEEVARAEAARVINAHGELPGSTKLRQLGYPRLAVAVIRAGGAAAFCLRHQLP